MIARPTRRHQEDKSDGNGVFRSLRNSSVDVLSPDAVWQGVVQVLVKL